MSTSSRIIPVGLSLRANFSWTFLGNVVYAACQWGMLILLTKLGSPEMVGQYALGLAIAAPIMAFATLKTRLVQATDATYQYRFGHYLALRLITTALALVAIIAIVLASDYYQETALVILAVGVAKAFESISDVFYGLQQQHERMDRVGKSRMIRGALSLIALTLGIALTGSVFWGSVFLTGTWALVLLGYDLRSGALTLRSVPEPGVPVAGKGRQRRVVRTRWEPRELAELAWLALPLGIVVALDSLRTNIPRYFIGLYMGEYYLGIFAPIAYLKQAGNIVAIALGLSITPRLAKYYAAGKRLAYRTLLLKLVGLTVLLGGLGVLVALVAGRQILTLLYQPEYAEYHDVLVLLMLAAGLDYVATSLDYGIIAARYFQIQLPLYALVAGTAALACVWLVPLYGLPGAGMAVILSTVVRLVGSLLIIAYAYHALGRHRAKEHAQP